MVLAQPNYLLLSGMCCVFAMKTKPKGRCTFNIAFIEMYSANKFHVSDNDNHT